MKLIVGLGNPGPKYAGNRHNIGFMAVDEIARGYGFAPWKKRFQGFTAEGQIGLEKCILLKPFTYMNESGRAVGEAMRFYKIPLADIIVIHDEIDLKPGAIRAKKGGGNAGHNGLKSISAHVGNEYVRVRLGIDHPGDKALVANYVLQDFAKADRTWLASLLEGVARGMAKLVEGSEAAFLSEAARGRSSSTPAAKLNGAVHATSSQLSPGKVHGALETEAEALASIAAAASRTIEPMLASPVKPEAWEAASAPAESGAAHAAPAEADDFAEPSDAGSLKHGIDQSEAEQAMQVLDPVDGALAAAAAHEVELFRAQASEPLFEPMAEDRAAAEAETIGEPRSLLQSRPEEPSAGLKHERNPEVSSRAKSDGSFWTRWFRKRLRGGAR